MKVAERRTEKGKIFNKGSKPMSNDITIIGTKGIAEKPVNMFIHISNNGPFNDINVILYRLRVQAWKKLHFFDIMKNASGSASVCPYSVIIALIVSSVFYLFKRNFNSERNNQICY